jgi:CheY-like chemotaxis protein
VIDVRSHPGEGTAVDVYLPAAEGEGLPAAAAPEEAPDARPRILFVEDEPALLELGQRQLESLGYRVTASASSLEALERFRTAPESWDLLITDNSMPRMTGLVLATEILELRPQMKVMMVSGLAEGLEPATLHAMGIRWVVRKPHTRQALAEAVRAAIEAP